MIFLYVIFVLSMFIIFWAMIGYPMSLIFLKKTFFKNKYTKKDYDYLPTVTVMIVAHNEEKVIKEKLENVITNDYPSERIKYLISSDNSNDLTNNIVRDFIISHPMLNMELYEARERKGKTNAQNEAQKLVNTEILIMTDANSLFRENAIRELVSTFVSEDIYYVCGNLVYVNEHTSMSSTSESTYWNLDLEMRRIESSIQTITAGNGSIYACRNKEYIDLDPIQSHDGNFPRLFALQGKKAKFNPDAIAYEKAGETIEDEYKRKVRMNRGILRNILPNIQILNVFKYKWYTYFYLGHRTSRYLLWLSQILLFSLSLLIGLENQYFLVIFVMQIIFYLIGFLDRKYQWPYKSTNLISYYCITIFAQIHGVYNILTGKVKPFWEKAESTR